MWSTNLDPPPAQRLAWCIRRWTLEVTREEARAHLRLETPRPWHARAIARTTPAWWSLEASITLTAHQRLQQASPMVRVTAWEATIRPPLADALALGRRHRWDHLPCSTSHNATDMIKVPRVLCHRCMDVVCAAASVDKIELRGYPETQLAKTHGIKDNGRSPYWSRRAPRCSRTHRPGNHIPQI